MERVSERAMSVRGWMAALGGMWEWLVIAFITGVFMVVMYAARAGLSGY